MPISVPALVLHVPLQDSVTLTEGQKKIVERVKTMGFTLKSQKRGKNSVGAFTRLEWAGRDGLIVEMSFNEASGKFITANTVCTIKIILDLPTDKAKARGEAAAKSFPEYSILVVPALERPGKSEVHFTVYEDDKRESDTVIPAHTQRLWEIAKACIDGTSLAPAKQVPPTSPIEQTLKAIGRPYREVGNAYAVTIRYSTTRSQVVYLKKTGLILGALKLHEVYSKFYESASALEPEKRGKLFERELFHGGIQVTRPEKNQGLWSIRYKVDVPTNCTAAELDTYLLMVASQADDMEKELSPTDRL